VVPISPYCRVMVVNPALWNSPCVSEPTVLINKNSIFIVSMDIKLLVDTSVIKMWLVAFSSFQLFILWNQFTRCPLYTPNND
jgi:hypothetical protein